MGEAITWWWMRQKTADRSGKEHNNPLPRPVFSAGGFFCRFFRHDDTDELESRCGRVAKWLARETVGRVTPCAPQ
jgi:hypothetical protein